MDTGSFVRIGDVQRLSTSAPCCWEIGIYFCLIVGAQFLFLFYRQLLHQYCIPWHSLFSIDSVYTISVHIILFNFLHIINAVRCLMEVLSFYHTLLS